MLNPKHWIGAALLAQPFHAEEIRMIGFFCVDKAIGLLGVWTAAGHAGAATARHASHLVNLHGTCIHTTIA